MGTGLIPTPILFYRSCSSGHTTDGKEAQEVFATFRWQDEEDQAKIGKVVDKFKAYCQLQKNIPFEHYRFNLRSQKPGESYDQYQTAL